MNFKDRKEKFYNRFGIIEKISENDAKEKFKVGMKNILENIDHNTSEDEVKKFCCWFGFEIHWQYTKNQVHNYKYGYNLLNCILKEDEWPIYLHKIESLFLLKIDKISRSYKKELFINVNEVFECSTLPIKIIESKGEYTIFPSGCDFLDDGLVIKILKFLNDKSHSHFLTALNFYSKNNRDSYIKSAESLRRSIEEYLRFLFNNNKGLAANIKELGAQLKILNKQNEIKNIFFNFFDHLDKFYNDNSKHNDGVIDKSECELIIYQTGLLYKYLDGIKNQLGGQISK